MNAPMDAQAIKRAEQGALIQYIVPSSWSASASALMKAMRCSRSSALPALGQALGSAVRSRCFDSGRCRSSDQEI
jgi:hypothetical protein